MAKKIFISYRRDDTQFQTDILYNELIERGVSKKDIFKDIESIGLGVNFDDAIDNALAQSEVVLVVIGNAWFNEKNKARLHNPEDFVRREIAKALAIEGKVVVPVLFDTQMPPTEELPEDLKPIWRRNAIEISRKYLENDMDELVQKLGLATGLGKFMHSAEKTEKAIKPLASVATKLIKWGAISVGVIIFLAFLIPALTGNSDSETTNSTDTTLNNAEYIPEEFAEEHSTAGTWNTIVTITDASGDMEQPYLDVVSGKISRFADTHIAFGIELVNAQQQVEYNHPDVPENSFEYEYSCSIDLNGDNLMDYMVFFGNLKTAGSNPSTDYLTNFCRGSVWQYTNGESPVKLDILVNTSLDGNWIWLQIPNSGDFVNLTSETNVWFGSMLFDGYDRISDSVKR